MGRSDSSILGIDIHESEIRVVHVRYRGQKATVVSSGATPLPSDAMNVDRILEPGSIAIALRRLIDSMRAGDCTRAVVGIPGGTTLRNLVLPRVPEVELPMVVAAEVEHQGLLRSHGSAYAYLKLWSPPDQKVQGDNIVILAVEDDVTSILRNAIERANLTVEAFEPAQFGMYRSVRLTTPSVPMICALMVGPSNTDLAFVNNGKLMAYRRIETGSQALLRVGPVTIPTASPFAFDEPEAVAHDEAHTFSATALDTLGTDCYRALDYFLREYPDLAAVERVYLAIDSAALVPLEGELSRRLGVPVELVKPIDDAEKSPDGTAPDERARYAAAFGLAMRDSNLASSIVPRIDLFSKERSVTEQVKTRRNFAGSIATSVAAIALGLTAFFLYGKQIGNVRQATAQERATAAQIKGETDLALQARARRASQYDSLRKEGVPVTAILDYVAAGLQPGVGISAISISENLKVTITGDAIDEPSMIKTVQALQSSPLLPGLIIDSFTRTPASNGITFQLSATTVPLNRIKFAAETKGGQ